MTSTLSSTATATATVSATATASSSKSILSIVQQVHHAQGPPSTMSEKLVAALTPGVDDTTNEDPLKKPIILVHGKPGVGKTTQSERIAKYTGLPLISLELIMARVTMTGGSSSSSSDGATPFNEEELSEAMRTLYADIRLQLVNGAEVAPEQVYRLVKDCLNGEDVVAKGAVIDASIFTKPDAPNSTMPLLEVLLARVKGTHAVVSVELTIADEDLLRRRVGQFVDPFTGHIFSAEQVQLSWTLGPIGSTLGKSGDVDKDLVDALLLDEDEVEQKNQEGEEDAEPRDNVPKLLNNIKQFNLNQLDKFRILDGRFPDPVQVDEDGVPLVTNEPPTPQETRLRAYLELKKNEHRLAGKTPLKKVPRDVLYRLVKRPEDTAPLVREALLDYMKVHDCLEKALRSMGKDVVVTLQIDGSQSPDAVLFHFRSVWKRVVGVLVRLAAVATAVRPLVANDGSLSIAARGLEESDTTDTTPLRLLSKWGYKCPVTYFEQRFFQNGSPKWTAAYEGRIFFFADEASLKKFTVQPDRYTYQPITEYPIRISLLGDEKICEKQGQRLASKLGLPLLMMDKEMRAFGAGPVPEEGPLIVEAISISTAVPSDIYVDYLQYHFAAKLPAHAGWVIVGFPTVREHAHRLCEAELQPHRVIVIAREVENDVKDVVEGLERASIGWSQVNPETTKDIDSLIDRVADVFYSSAESIQEVPADMQVMLGYCKEYCPVQLKDHNLLVKGQRTFGARFNSHYYMLSRDKALAKFLASPDFYTSSKDTLAIPPPRIMVSGAFGTGKSALVGELHKILRNVPVVDFEKFFAGHLATYPAAQRATFAALQVKKESLPVEVVSAAISKLYTMEPFCSRGFIVDGFPRTKDDAAALQATPNIAVDLLLSLRAEVDVILKRKLQQVTEPMTVEQRVDVQTTIMERIDIENSGCVEAFAQLEGDAHLNLTEMDMNKPLPSVMNTLKNTHAEILENRSSVFFSAHVLPIADAEELLKAGVKKLSVFGRNCPVEAKRQNLLLKQCVGCWPTVVNNFVFFCFDEANQREFLQRTAEYIRPALELTPQMARICIVGPPKSGKTTLAQRLALTFNLELVTVSKAIQYLTEVSNKSALCSSVLQHLNAGHCVPDELVVAALEAYVTRALCSVKGWVLDGYPLTLAQAKLMEGRSSIMPQKIFELTASLDEIEKRGLNDYEENVSGKVPIVRMDTPMSVAERYKVFVDGVGEMRDFFRAKYGPFWTEVSGCLSKWAVEDTVGRAIQEYLVLSQYYRKAVKKGIATPCNDVGLTLSERDASPSQFGDYCVVSWADRQELVKVQDSTYAVSFEGKRYRLAGSKEMLAFLSSPKQYAKATGFPDKFPAQRAGKETFDLPPSAFEYQGYCPVTLFDGPPDLDSIVCGRTDLVAEYNGKLYAMLDEKKLEKFMRKPTLYAEQKLRESLPPRKSDTPLTDLPILRFLEAYLASILNRALVAVGTEKPKYPFCSLDKSAALFIALYLNANNPNLKLHVRKQYEQALNEFRAKCDIVQFLAKTMTKEYQVEGKRHAEFEGKMQEFLNSQKKGFDKPGSTVAANANARPAGERS